ncbi:MAG: hypothetical protein M3P34_06965 [Actinomycetota bacterium]|nr:hypothetical protein [Actinomycetota bacterium]
MSESDDPIPGEGDPVATGPKGSGEWPDPASPPTGAAPGTDPSRKAALEAERDSHRTFDEGAAAELHPPSDRDGDLYDR